jgi:RimJ/RimL family protein N-acetyltransferase
LIDHGFGVKLGPISDLGSECMRLWRNEPEIYKWCRQYEPISFESHRGWIESLPKRSDVKMYGIYDSDWLGVCGLTSVDLINRKAEFSLYIGPEHQGKGYGKAALKTLCAHGFKAIGLNHIFGESFDGNPAIKMFEDVGFKKEGTRRSFYFRDGKFVDAHLYSLLADEWKY